MRKFVLSILLLGTLSCEAAAPLELLFVVHSDVATSEAKGDDQYELTIPLQEPGDVILLFSDRPYRMANVMTRATFAAQFVPGSSFAQDPPNAVLDYRDAVQGGRKVALVVIQGVKIRDGDLVLTVSEKDFSQIDKTLQADALPAMMHSISVFIDSGTGSLTQLIAVGQHESHIIDNPDIIF